VATGAVVEGLDAIEHCGAGVSPGGDSPEALPEWRSRASGENVARNVILP